MSGNPKAQEGAALMQALVTGFQAVVASNRAVVTSNERMAASHDRLTAALVAQAQAQAQLASVMSSLSQQVDGLSGRMDLLTTLMATENGVDFPQPTLQDVSGGGLAAGLAGAAIRGLMGGFRPAAPPQFGPPPHFGPGGRY